MQKSIEAIATGTVETRRMELEDSAVVSGEIMWVGDYWTNGKHLKHYAAFRSNGVTIPVRSFCYIIVEKRGEFYPSVAYIVDLYEDRKSQKKMKVKWLQKSTEIESQIPPPEPLKNEVFMTRKTQVYRLECCDGVVYVLTPNHYEASKLSLASSGEHVFVCGRHFGTEGVKTYDVSAVEGYWSQTIFFSRFIPQYLSDIARENTERMQASSVNAHEDEQAGSAHVIKSGIKAPRSARRRLTGKYDLNDEVDWTPQQESCQLSYDLVDAGTSSAVPLLKVFRNTDSRGFSAGLGQGDWARVGKKVEFLSQDSGLKGCWFRCIVLEMGSRLKIRYDDIREVDTEKPLEEWVSVGKVTCADKPGFRIPGRQMMRPLPPEMEKLSDLEQGSAVDVWGGEGWWEGIIIGKNAFGQFKVVFPDEEYLGWFDESKVRTSREWVDGQWLAVRPDANIIDKISGLPTERLVSSCVEGFCPANDRSLCSDILSGLETAEFRDGILPVKAVNQSFAANHQANKVLALHYERPSINQDFQSTSGKVKGFSARQTSTQEPIFSDCKEGIKLSNHYSKGSAKVVEPSSAGRREHLKSECPPADSSRSSLENNGSSQPAELQVLDVDRDKGNNSDVVDTSSEGLRLFSKISRKRHRDADTSCFAGSKDCSADLLLNRSQGQEDLSVGVFTLNNLTEVGNGDAKHPQYGFEQVKSSSGASVGGPLFNSVSVQNLVLSR